MKTSLFAGLACAAAGLLLLTGQALAADAASAPPVPADPVKVGFVYVGPVGDHGWSYQHDQGRKAVEAHFGDAVATAFVENVAEGADAERVITQFAQQGYDLVFTTSFGFMNPTVKAAKRFPKVTFEHATGYKRAANLSTYMARFYEGRAVIGHIAGHMTTSGVIGYIAPFPIPEVVRGIDAFTIALRKVAPDAEVKVIWVNSWYDPGKEREAAETLVAQGADILVQHTDSPAPIQVAEEKGVYAFGQASDMTAFGPRAHLTAIVDHWSDYYIAEVQAVLDGTWTSHDTWGGFKDDMVHLAPLNDAIPEDVKASALALRDAIAAGEVHPFAGPLRNQAGDVVVPEGETLSDDKLLSLDWYVEGVQGRLPQ
jgi:simple sugar transport system substrate-binding protein